MQDVFVELWTRRQTVAAEVHSIKSYLIKSLRRRIVRRLSENTRFLGRNLPRGFSEEVEFNIEVNMVADQTSRERSMQLQASMATLSQRQQEVLYLKFHENMDYDDIAVVMNTNVKAVYNLVSRSIASLRKFFELHPMASD
jgi:RNA polymerase sigma factor (sigma-70 family)